MHVQEIVTPQQHYKRYVVVDNGGDLIIPVVRYLKYLDAIGRARNTLRAYAHSLSLYFSYLAQQKLDYQEVTLDDLGGFVRLRSRIPTARSKCFRCSQFPSAKGKLVEKNLLKQRMPKRGRPKTLAKEHIETLVNACENMRDQLLLMLLYESSLRVGECLALWIEEVDVDGRKIHVRDRGELSNNAEIKTPASCSSVDVSDGLINQILDYLVIVHSDEVETNHLFIKLRGAHSGQPLEYAEVNDLFQRLKSKTGIDAHAHLLRHSSLTSLAKSGMRPEVLRERAGHAQFQYTYQLYVHPEDEEMRQEWEQVEEALQLRHSTRGEGV
jgi:integrase/recombinase XerD